MIRQQEAQKARKRPYDYSRALDGTYHVFDTREAAGFFREGIRFAIVARLTAQSANRRAERTAA